LEDRSPINDLEDEKRREEETTAEMDEIGDSKWYIWYMNVVWLGAGGIMVWFFVQIIQQHIQSVQQPSSTIVIETLPNLELPIVVVCNWNQNGSPQDPVPSESEAECSVCILTLISCTFWGAEGAPTSTASNCSDLWSYQMIQTNGGQFSCYVFNQNAEDPMSSNSTGYGGSYATVWKVDLENSTNPPVNRGGLQASFLPNVQPGQGSNAIPGNTIYNEYRFSQIGQDTFFAMQLIVTTHQEITNTSNPLFNQTRYDTTASAVSLLVDPAAAAEQIGYVGVSFAFQNLNAQFVLFNIAYTLNNLFGDFSGMVGTLLGLDAIKVSASFPLMFLAAKHKVVGPLREHFNG